MNRPTHILVWITCCALIFASIAVVFLTYENDDPSVSKGHNLAVSDKKMIEMGEACLHHVHNMNSSADANLKDIYSVDANNSPPSVSNPEYAIWQATMQCLINYPLYGDQYRNSNFNTSLE